MTTMATVVLVALMAVASWFDVRERRIPNFVTVTGVAVVLGLRLAAGDGAVVAGMFGVGMAILFALPPFVLGMMGGGDAKLLAVVGGFMGPGRLVGAVLVIAVLGGVLALVEAVRRRVLVRTLSSTYGFAKQWVLMGRAGVAPTLESPGTLTVPYGVAIAAGAVTWWFLVGATL